MAPTLIDRPAAPAALGAGADVVAHTLVRAAADMLPALRRRPGSDRDEPLPAALLKHADDQTVVGLAALARASRRDGSDVGRFAGWGIVAAPRFLGRAALALSLERFLAEGAWGVSPHIVPHDALHAASGTISQVLKIHGPNLGVGGGPGGQSEGLLAALTLLEDGHLPGVWLVLSGWTPELVIGREGHANSAGECQALALALVAPREGWRGPRLRIVGGSCQVMTGPACFDLPRLDERLTALRGADGPASALAWPLGDAAGIELTRAGVEGVVPARRAGARRFEARLGGTL